MQGCVFVRVVRGWNPRRRLTTEAYCVDMKNELVYRYLAEDHRRLEELLRRATIAEGSIEPGAYMEFRGGLLRHIGMEEKILLPAAQAARSGDPLPLASRLRLDHGALAGLLVLT